MGIILFLVARFLQWLLTPVFFIYAIIRLRNFKKISEYFHKVAFSIDQLGNTMGGPIMNDVLITKDGYKYGCEDETISYATAVNLYSNTLSPAGLALARILDMIDKGHMEDAAKSEQ